MLLLRGKRRLADAEICAGVIFGKDVWLNVVRRQGLTLDTRLCPAAKGEPRTGTCLFVLLEGSFEVHEPKARFDGPCIFAMSEEHLEGARGKRPLTYETQGEPFVAIELHFREGDAVEAPALPAALVLREAAWISAGMRLAGCVERDAADAEISNALVALLTELAREDIVRTGCASRVAEPLPFERTLRLVRPLAERFALAATLDELLRFVPVSRRQMDRYLRSFFELFPLAGTGWRATTVHLRLKLAVLFLSAADTTVGTVAQIVGYGSVVAMARAFREAGIPAPMDIRELFASRRSSVP